MAYPGDLVETSLTFLDYARLGGDRAIALLLRHAERPPLILGGDFGRALSLTENGRNESRRLGAHLGSRLRSFRTSPTPRCRETCALIREGAGSSSDILEDRLLGEPSVLSVDAAIANQNWVKLGYEGVIEHLAVHDEPLPGMRNPIEAANLLLTHLLERFDEQPSARAGIHLFVTHDIVISTFVSRVLKLGKPVWPSFLDGAAVFRDGSDVRLAFDGTVHTIPI